MAVWHRAHAGPGSLPASLRESPRFPRVSGYTSDTDGVDTGGCANTLTKYHPSPLAKGNPGHTALVEIVKAWGLGEMAEELAQAGADYGFYFDQTVCNGCKVCQIACIDKHDLPLGVMWRRVLEYIGRHVAVVGQHLHALGLHV